MASSDVSSVTKHFPVANEGFTTTTSGAVSSGGTTVGLNSVSGLTNGDVFVGIIEPGETKEQTFTGTVDTSGVQITNVVWTRGTNVDHSAGVTVVDYVTGTGNNMVTKGILVHTDQDGTLKAGAVDNSAVMANDVVETANIAPLAVTTTELAEAFFKGRRQDDNNDSITDSAVTGLTVQFGWGQRVGNGTASMSEAVTFDDAFSSAPIVIIGQLGAKSTTAATAIGGISSPDSVSGNNLAGDITTTGFNVFFRKPSGTYSATNYYGYSWIAFGVAA